MKFFLSPVVPRDPNTETDLQYTESRRHKCITPRTGRKKRCTAETHQAKTHDRNNAHGKCSTRDNSGPVKQQPNTWQHRRSPSRIQSESQQAANDNWRSKAKKKFAPRTRKKSRVRPVRFRDRCRRGDRHRNKSLNQPNHQPGARRRLARCNKGRRERGNPHRHAAPSGHSSKLCCVLHGFANVFEMVNGAGVNRNGLALVRTKRASGYHAKRLLQKSASVKYFILQSSSSKSFKTVSGSDP